MDDSQDSDEPTRGDVEAKAVRFLARRSHAREELARKLRRRDFPGGLVEEVLESLEEQGYLDDAEFARQQGAILARKCWGPRQISHKLRRRGVDETTVDEALARIGEDEDWEQRALQRLRSRFGEPGELEEDDLGRAYRHLTRRGYAPNLVRSLLFDR